MTRKALLPAAPLPRFLSAKTMRSTEPEKQRSSQQWESPVR